jgi:membrane-bound lytic murein transglycosylase D
MNDLYELYHDWALVLAAYNSGAGNVNRAIRKAGGVMDFWVIQKYLPRETRDYVPAFIAASYVMHHAAEYNLFPVYPGISAAEIDSVAVHQFLSFDQLAGALNVSLENIRYLNPCYTKDVIPASADRAYYLRLPKKNIIDFVNNEQAVYAFKTQKSLEREQMMAQVKELKDNSTLHVVRKGETLASIANKYNCTPAEIKKWNRLKKGTVKARQELLVYVKKKTPPAPKTDETLLALQKAEKDPSFVGPPVDSANLAKTLAANTPKPKPVVNNDKYIYHTIRQGDTLWEIATRYKATVEQIKNLNNIKNANSLKPGQKIKVGIDG